MHSDSQDVSHSLTRNSEVPSEMIEVPINDTNGSDTNTIETESRSSSRLSIANSKCSVNFMSEASGTSMLSLASTSNAGNIFDKFTTPVKDTHTKSTAQSTLKKH